MGTIGYGAVFLPPLMLFSFFKSIFCSKPTPHVNDVESSKNCSNCCKTSPNYNERLFIVCAIKGTDFCTSAREDGRLISNVICKKLRMFNILWLIIRIIAVTTIFLCTSFLIKIDKKVFDIFTYVIVFDAVIELTTFCTTNSWTKLLYYCKLFENKKLKFDSTINLILFSFRM